MTLQNFLASVFKLLGDETRLKILELIANHEYTTQELAEKLELSPPTISHHLSKFREMGFLTIRMVGTSKYHRLNDEMYERFIGHMPSLLEMPAIREKRDTAWIDDLPLEDWEKKIIKNNTYNRRLRRIPAKEKKLLAVLNWISLGFESDKIYTEKEVNIVIEQYHPDYATLRRDLVEFGYMRRERGGETYWVTPKSES